MCYRLLLLLAALVLAGCRRAPEPAFERIAVPPFENLTGDDRFDWMSAGFGDRIVHGITGSPRSHPFPVDSPAGAAALRATHILHGYFRLAGEHLRVEASLEDLRTLTPSVRASAAGPLDQGPGPLADRIVALLGRRGRAARTRSSEALRLYAESFTSPDPVAALERAVAADPDFAAPYLGLFRVNLARGDAAAARAALGRALQRPGLDALDRARFELMTAAFSGDSQAQLRQLEALSRLLPAEGEIFQSLASRRLLQRDYQGALLAYREALARDPDNPMLLNETGYASAYAADFQGAVAALQSYRRLQPAEPNPPDSLGDIYYQFGSFAEAEKYYLESADKAPDFAGSGSLFKAAHARLMGGEVEAADQLFEQFLQRRAGAGDPLVELRRAEWHYVTGRRQQGARHLAAWSGAGRLSPDHRALALSMLSFWSLESGERPEARRYAERAAAAARTPLVRLCLFLTGAEVSPAEWTLRAGKVFPQAAEETLRQTALSYALLLGRHFREAVPVLRDLLAKTPPAPAEPTPFLLAWALLESGQDPGGLLGRWPAPEPQPGRPFHSLIFPRVLFLRAWWLDKQGRPQEGQPLYRLFLKYTGEWPASSEEPRRARAALKP